MKTEAIAYLLKQAQYVEGSVYLTPNGERLDPRKIPGFDMRYAKYLQTGDLVDYTFPGEKRPGHIMSGTLKAFKKSGLTWDPNSRKWVKGQAATGATGTATASGAGAVSAPVEGASVGTAGKRKGPKTRTVLGVQAGQGVGQGTAAATTGTVGTDPTPGVVQGAPATGAAAVTATPSAPTPGVVQGSSTPGTAAVTAPTPGVVPVSAAPKKKVIRHM